MVQLVVDDEVEIGVRRLEIRTFPFTLIAGRERMRSRGGLGWDKMI